MTRALLDPDEDTLTRRAATNSLATLGDPASLDALLSLLSRRDVSPALRLSMAGSVSRFRQDPRAFAALRAVSTDANDDSIVRAAAVRQMSGFGQYHPTDVLLAALDDPAERVRRAAADALGKLGDADTAAALERIRQDAASSEHLRAAAREASASIKRRLELPQSDGEDNVGPLLNRYGRVLLYGLRDEGTGVAPDLYAIRFADSQGYVDLGVAKLPTPDADAVSRYLRSLLKAETNRAGRQSEGHEHGGGPAQAQDTPGSDRPSVMTRRERVLTDALQELKGGDSAHR